MGEYVNIMDKTTVALIACCKSKLKTAVPVPAEQLYQGQLFQAQLAYARQVLEVPDERIYVLSALYQLTGIQEHILPYEATLADRTLQQRIAWGECVVGMLREQGHYQHSERLAIMAGKVYRQGLGVHLIYYNYEWLVPHPKEYGYGEQVAWYQLQTRELDCAD